MSGRQSAGLTGGLGAGKSGGATTTVPLPRGRLLDLGGPAVVMGILNATPDSFYEGSRRQVLDEALEAASAMIQGGAGILDVGGESTRPGAAYVSLEEELERVVPVVEAIRRRWDIPVSVDTRKAGVARAAVQAGADMINDVSALEDDPGMAAFCAGAGLPVVLMHKKGVPATMQDRPYYDDCPEEVCAFLLAAADRAVAAGIRRELIILDPGIGFGKRYEDNIAVLFRLDELVACGYPVLVGLSRKAFVGAITGHPAEGRLAGSLGAACAARIKGASIFRVHDVE
ncbi:MAG: dihydropteroate synthase, partial [Clostridia bacterium]